MRCWWSRFLFPIVFVKWSPLFVCDDRRYGIDFPPASPNTKYRGQHPVLQGLRFAAELAYNWTWFRRRGACRHGVYCARPPLRLFIPVVGRRVGQLLHGFVGRAQYCSKLFLSRGILRIARHPRRGSEAFEKNRRPFWKPRNHRHNLRGFVPIDPAAVGVSM